MNHDFTKHLTHPILLSSFLYMYPLVTVPLPCLISCTFSDLYQHAVQPIHEFIRPLVTITNIRTMSRCPGNSGSSGPGTLFLALYKVDHIVTFLITIFLRTWHSENTWTRTEICTTSPPETSHQLKHQYITQTRPSISHTVSATPPKIEFQNVLSCIRNASLQIPNIISDSGGKRKIKRRRGTRHNGSPKRHFVIELRGQGEPYCRARAEVGETCMMRPPRLL